jgi:hypothetical protein
MIKGDFLKSPFFFAQQLNILSIINKIKTQNI